jgi:uncharacterized membrane protein
VRIQPLAPIVAWTGSLVLDLLSKTGVGPDILARGAYWLLFAGIVMAVLAAMGRRTDPMGVLAPAPAASVTVLPVVHQALNTGALAIFAVGALIRLADGLESVSPAALALSLLGLLVLGISGRLAGRDTAAAGGPAVGGPIDRLTLRGRPR